MPYAPYFDAAEYLMRWLKRRHDAVALIGHLFKASTLVSIALFLIRGCSETLLMKVFFAGAGVCRTMSSAR